MSLTTDNKKSEDSCIQVAVRIRPMVGTEKNAAYQHTVFKQVVGDQPQVFLHADKKPFAFNYVFDVADSQKTVYEELVAPLIKNLFKGYNASVLAYGQTGSGKTYTMGTVFNSDDNQERIGIIPRSISHIFEQIEGTENYDVFVSCSFFEVYKEQIYDLLSGEPREKSIREFSQNTVVGLTKKEASNPKQCMNHLVEGSKLRSTGATKMNKVGSRSHAIFAIDLKFIPKTDSDPEICSKFMLVDLAGSERCKKTGAEGERLKEGITINKGLFVLGNVINALSDKKPHIPYRESALTKILEESLGGNSHTKMIACISPADYNSEENLNTLKYANRVKNIKNKPTQNIDQSAVELKHLRDEVNRLRMMLLNQNPGVSLDNGAEIHTLKAKITELATQNKHLLEEKSNLLIEMTNIDWRATMAEDLHDEVQNELLELKFKLKNTEEVQNEGNEAGQKGIDSLFAEIEDRMKKFKSEKNMMMIHLASAHNPNGPAGDGDTEKHAVKQEEMQKKIRDINKELEVKEQLLLRLQSNATTLNSSQSLEMVNYEETIQALIREVEDLRSKEKFKDKKDTKTQKLSEERRKKIQEHECRIQELRKRCLQQEKLLKIKQRDSERVKTLGQEITAMRQEKIRIMRQMKHENDHFRAYRIAREKELNKLKEQDKKRQNELIRKEAMHQKQQQVMRRKMDEAMALNKRLKETLDTQVTVRKQKESKTSDVENLLLHELDIVHSVTDAKITVKQLCDDRAVLNIRMNELKKEDEVTGTCENTAEILALEEDIKLRSAQIADFQSQVMTTNIESKIKEIQDRIHTVPDFRSALKCLIKQSVENREKFTELTNQMNDLKSHNEVLEEEKAILERKIPELRHAFAVSESNIQRMYEEKMVVLLREIEKNNYPKKVKADTPDSVGFQEGMSHIVQGLHDDLQLYRERISELESILEDRDNQQNKITKRSKKKMNDTFDANASILDLETSDDDSSDTSDGDPDWRATPLAKRVRKTRSLLRQSFAVPAPVPPKRSNGETFKFCACKGDCNTKICSCRKREEGCSGSCKCVKTKCTNQVLEPKTPEIKRQPFAIKSEESQNQDPNATFNVNINSTPADQSLLTRKRRLPDLDLTPFYPYANKKRRLFLKNDC